MKISFNCTDDQQVVHTHRDAGLSDQVPCSKPDISPEAYLNDYRNRMPFHYIEEGSDGYYYWQYGSIMDLVINFEDEIAQSEDMPEAVLDVRINDKSVVDPVTGIAHLGSMAIRSAEDYYTFKQTDKIVRTLSQQIKDLQEGAIDSIVGSQEELMSGQLLMWNPEARRLIGSPLVKGEAEKSIILKTSSDDPNYAMHEGSVLLGKGLSSSFPYQFIVGYYNKLTPEEVFSVGTGFSNETRSTAFSISHSGRVKVFNPPVDTDDVVRKKELDAVKGIADNAVVSNEAIQAGTHTKITYDSKGLVTSGSDLTPDDIPELHTSKITSGVFSDDRIASANTWNAKQDALTAEQLSALNSGITSIKVATYDRYPEIIDKKLDKTGGTISGSLIISENLIVNGTTSAVDTQNLKVANKLIYVAKDNTVALTSPAGLITPKYDGMNNGGIVYDNTGTAYVGDITLDSNVNVDVNNSDLQPIATRSPIITDGNIIEWDNTNKTLVDSGKKINDLSTATNLENGEGENSLIQKSFENKENKAYQRNSVAFGSNSQAGMTEDEFDLHFKYDRDGNLKEEPITDDSGSVYSESNGYALAAGEEVKAKDRGSVAFGIANWAWGAGSSAMGDHTQALSNFSHSFGKETVAGKSKYDGECATAFGKETRAEGENSFAIGYNTTASGIDSFAGGQGATASNKYSFAFGWNAKSTGFAGVAFGEETQATGADSFVAGRYSQAIGNQSIALGSRAIATGTYSVAIGYNVKSTGWGQIAVGSYNNPDVDGALFMVGNGNGNKRKNAFEVLYDGRAKVQSAPVDDNDVVRRIELDNSWNDFNLENGTGLDSLVQTYSGKVDDTHYASSTTGESDVCLGEANTSSGKRNVIGGKLNQNTGSNNLITGLRNNISSNHNVVGGQENTSSQGNDNLIGGQQNTVKSGNNIVAGHENTVSENGQSNIVVGEQNLLGRVFNSIICGDNDNIQIEQLIAGIKVGYDLLNNSDIQGKALFGHYNSPKTNTLLEIGNGTDIADNKRSNAFEVLKDGRAKVQSAPIESNDVVRKCELNILKDNFKEYLADNFVVKFTNPNNNANRRYVLYSYQNGVHDVIRYSSAAAEFAIAQYTGGGNLVVASPRAETHAATKGYVDDVRSTLQASIDNIKLLDSKILLDGDLIFTEPFGKYTVPASGSYTISSKNSDGSTKTLRQLFEEAFSEKSVGTTNYPTYSFLVSGSQEGEVGSTYALPSATFTVTSVGSYQYGPETGITFSVTLTATNATNVSFTNLTTNGTATIYAKTAAGDFKAKYTEDAATGNTTTYTFEGSYSYTEGAAPKTNLGDFDSIKKIEAKSNQLLDTKKVTFRGYRKMFIGISEKSTGFTSDEIRALSKINEKAVRISNRGFTVSAGDKTIVIAYPTSLTESAPKLETQSLGNWNEQILVPAGTLKVTDASLNSSTAKDYYIYTYTPSSGSFEATTPVRVTI